MALILELGANLHQHCTAPDLILVVSRDDWLIRAAEAAQTRGARVWVAYARNDAIPAQTLLPTLLLPTVNTGSVSPPTQKTSETQPPVRNTILEQIRARCEQQPKGGYRANEVGQALHQLGLTEKTERTRFLQSIPGLQEVGSGANKRLIF